MVRPAKAYARNKKEEKTGGLVKLLFFGTPQIAVPFLDALLKEHEVVGAITQPDRPCDRGQKMRYTPVKELAIANNIPVFQPEKYTPEVIEQLKKLKPDAGVVVSYGKLIPHEAFETPAMGCFNIHFSLLPKYRGASPVQKAVINGEKETGVTTFRLERTLDTGPVFIQKSVSIAESDNTETLFEKLIPMGIAAARETLVLLKNGDTAGTPQLGEPSYAPGIKKEDGRISWDKAAVEIYNLARGLKIWPGAYTEIGSGKLIGKKIKILKSSPAAQSGAVKPAGTITEIVKQKGFLVQCGDGLLLIEEVHPENRSPMPAWAFIQGSHLGPGDILK
jgi:methionyl-tRNA formyltransferase